MEFNGRSGSTRSSNEMGRTFSPPRGRSSGNDGAARDRKQMPARQQTQCRFCRRGDKYVDYKDIETLQKLLTHRGKIYSRKRSGNCAGCQRKVKRAIQRARYMALLPFCA